MVSAYGQILGCADRIYHYHSSLFNLYMGPGSTHGRGFSIGCGKYVGWFRGFSLLSANFSALTMFASILAKNTVSAFLTALFLCFFQLYGWEQVALLFYDFWWYNFISSLGMELHYFSISKGVLLMSDAVYFIALTALFLVFTHRQLLKIKSL